MWVKMYPELNGTKLPCTWLASLQQAILESQRWQAEVAFSELGPLQGSIDGRPRVWEMAEGLHGETSALPASKPQRSRSVPRPGKELRNLWKGRCLICLSSCGSQGRLGAFLWSRFPYADTLPFLIIMPSWWPLWRQALVY